MLDRRPRRRRILTLLACAGLAACGGGAEEGEGIGRDVFIDAYVDLRTTALRSDDGVLDEAERAEVLARHGITEADLLDFAERHGADAEMMRDTWDEVERRLDEETLAPPSA